MAKSVTSGSDECNSLNLNGILMELSGIWFTKTNNQSRGRIIGYYITKIWFVCASSCLLLTFRDNVLLQCEIELEDWILGLLLTALLWVILVEVSTNFIRRGKIEKMKEVFYVSDQDVKKYDKVELKIISHHANLSQRLTRMFVMLSSAAGFAFAARSSTQNLIRGDEGISSYLPIIGCYPFDVNKPFYFSLVYVWSFFGIFGCGFMNGVCLSYMMSMLIFVIGRFKILQHRLLNIRKNARNRVNVIERENARKQKINVPVTSRRFKSVVHDRIEDIRKFGKSSCLENRLSHGNGNSSFLRQREKRSLKSEFFQIRKIRNLSNTKTSTDRKNVTLKTNDDIKTRKTIKKTRTKLSNKIDLEMNRILIECIVDHQNLYSFMNDFQMIYGNVFLWYGFLSSLCFCNVVFLLSLTLGDLTSTAFMIVILCTGIVMVGLPCTLRTILLTESANVSDAAYGSDWFETSTEFKKSLIFMMTHTTRDLPISTFGFIPFSLEYFANVLNQAYSLYTMLNTFNGK